MNRKIFFTILLSFLISGVAYSEIDLSSGFNGKTMFGYTGIEINSSYSGYSSNKNKDDIRYFEKKYSEIIDRKENLVNILENRNKDNDFLIAVNYNKFKFENYNSNNYSLIFGKATNNRSIAGIGLNFSKGEIKGFKDEGIGGQLFYSYDNQKSSFISTAYIGKNKVKDNNYSKKDLYYGIYGKYSKNLLENYIGYFDYISPAMFVDTTIQRYRAEGGDKKESNNSINSTVGFEGKNEITFENTIIESTLKIGYNREFKRKEKYRSENLKENDIDRAVGEIGINIKYQDFIGVNVGYKIEKSLNTSNYQDRIKVGVSFKF